MTIFVGGAAGGGGAFIAKFSSKRLEVLAGATGAFITITPPAGQRARLTTMATDTNSTQNNNIQIEVGGSIVVASGIYRNAPNQNGAYSVGLFQAGNATTLGSDNAVGIVPTIMGEPDEVIIVRATGAPTDRAMRYSYETGILA